ncbi:hypothetical protein NLX85_21740 [Micromonospora sp. A3M-1-15]|nr:hypothetical protein [Micromonospora sp. A3M-1-15]MCP3785990.1 hypothetical protein [Micromonospora sp. A3M-1-15]
MAVLLRGMTEASWAVERTFTELRLNHHLFVPDADGGRCRFEGTDDEVLIWGSRLLFDPYDGVGQPSPGGHLEFDALTIRLPHLPVEVTDHPSEIRLYLRLTLREDGFTLTAGIDVDLLQPVFRYPAGEHTVMRVTEELTTVDETVAAARRAVDAFADHHSLFDDIGFPRRP